MNLTSRMSDKPGEDTGAGKVPSMSVVVRVYNSQSTLKQCLAAVKASAYKDYELIVVDDASRDMTETIAAAYADTVIRLGEHRGRFYAKEIGLRAARAQIIVNIDSDVVIREDSLGKIFSYAERHPEVSALTGRLAKEYPYPHFFSRYKNLYMNYIFGKLPEKINFLYGSICAMRKEAIVNLDFVPARGQDTIFGMKMILEGKEIRFLRDLEVVHLKKYTFMSFVKNDFLISFSWAKVIVLGEGWKQLWKNKTGFAHAPRWQIMSVAAAPATMMIGFLSFFLHAAAAVAFVLAAGWFSLNIPLLKFFFTERGFLFGLCSAGITFLDNVVMFCGIISGFGVGILSMLRTSWKRGQGAVK
ncbi:MAG: glycosyltransferase family 2 protein [Candidatus Omnitrophota bacterium]